MKLFSLLPLLLLHLVSARPLDQTADLETRGASSRRDVASPPAPHLGSRSDQAEEGAVRRNPQWDVNARDLWYRADRLQGVSGNLPRLRDLALGYIGELAKGVNPQWVEARLGEVANDLRGLLGVLWDVGSNDAAGAVQDAINQFGGVWNTNAFELQDRVRRPLDRANDHVWGHINWIRQEAQRIADLDAETGRG
jgi:hypothetical protein